MKHKIGLILIVLLHLMGAVHSGNSTEDVSGEMTTFPSYFENKVKALNTALYYILLSLQEDLKAGVEVDISFLKRIDIITKKIKAFGGKVDEINTILLGESRKMFPNYLVSNMEEATLDFDKYTETTPGDTILFPISAEPFSEDDF